MRFIFDGLIKGMFTARRLARDVNSATYASFEAFSIAAVLYAVIAFTLISLFRVTERRLLALTRA
ncbi:ABC-type arginine/histidine transport system permease subunit [Ensifer sp. KUDG1]|uniref:hypothetical protein n=1 Tax=Ensifer sp. KUDG1 TaxID=3373919 RepID=UPI003D213DA5